MLTIIIPHYNSVQSLEKLLNSIPSTNEIEVIVIDDNSTEQVQEYNKLVNSSKYEHVIFLINNTEKKGAGVCRNIGLEHMSSNKWVLFADADDYFVEGFYDIVKEYFESDFDIVYFTPTSIEIDTGNLSDRHIRFQQQIYDYLTKKDRNSELKLRYEFPVPWSKLISAKLIKENNIKFDEVIASNDVMFSTKIGYYAKNIAASNKIIYCVTKNKGSLTNTISEEMFDTRLNVRINYCKYLKSRLKKEDQKAINLSGRAMLIYSITYKLGIKKILLTYLELRKNNIEVFDLRYLNPVLVFTKIRELYNSENKNNKYRVK